MGILNDFRKAQEDFDIVDSIQGWFLDYLQAPGFKDFIIANAIPAPPLYRGMYFYDGDVEMADLLKTLENGWGIRLEWGEFASFTDDFEAASGFAQQADWGAIIEIHGATGIKVSDYISMEEHPTASKEREWLVAEFSGKAKSHDMIYDYLVHVVME